MPVYEVIAEWSGYRRGYQIRRVKADSAAEAKIYFGEGDIILDKTIIDDAEYDYLTVIEEAVPNSEGEEPCKT